MRSENSFLRDYLPKGIAINPLLGFALIIVFGVPRFMATLYANQTGNYSLMSVIFLIMWFMPWILLNKSGRALIGFHQPIHIVRLLIGFLVGGAVSWLVYYMGNYLYADTVANWYAYISNSYSLPNSLSSDDKLIYFWIFLGIGITFSPIGEEFLYRGIIHQCFVGKYGENKASMIDSLAFGLTHLAHFGILYYDAQYHFLLVPAILWVALMFFASRIFYFSKAWSGSIWGAVLSHAGFNAVMTYTIFYLIL